MSYVLFRDIFKSPEKYAGQTIKVAGWVRTIRASKAFGFIELNDGTHYKNIQVVLNKIKDYFKELNYNIDTYNKLILSNGIMYKSYKENIETSDNDNSIANFLKVISLIILGLTIVGIIGILIFSTTNKIIIISTIIIIKLIITGFISAIVFRTFAEMIYILDDIRKKI